MAGIAALPKHECEEENATDDEHGDQRGCAEPLASVFTFGTPLTILEASRRRRIQRERQENERESGSHQQQAKRIQQ